MRSCLLFALVLVAGSAFAQYGDIGDLKLLKASDKVAPDPPYGGFGTGIFIPYKSGETVTGSIYYKYSGSNLPNVMLVISLDDANGNTVGDSWRSYSVQGSNGSYQHQTVILAISFFNVHFFKFGIS